MKTFFRRNLRKIMIFSGFLKALAIPFNLIVANAMAGLITYAMDGNVGCAVNLSLFILVFVLSYKLIYTILNVCYGKMMVETQHKCKMRLYGYYLENPLSRLYGFGQGDFLEKLNDDFKVVVGKYSILIPALGADLLMVIVYVCFLIKRDWLLTLVLFFMALLQILPPLIVKRFMQKNYENCRDIEGKLTDLVLEGYRGFLEIKMYQLKEWYLNKVAVIHKDYLNIGSASSGAFAIETSMDTFIEYLLRYGVAIVTGVFVLCGRIELEIGISAIVLSASLFTAVKSVFSTIPNFAVTRTAENRITEGETNKVQKNDFVNREIQLTNMTYEQSGKVIFRNVDYTFHGSGVTVIKGENGIGKSTLLKLITGLLKCQKGTVTIGGADVNDLSEDNFPTTIFYLPQERSSMDLSVTELLEMMNPETKTLEITAGIFGIDDKWKEKRLEMLSGGEEKRLLLAVAFAVNPEILILDEPTNSLDTEARTKLLKMLEEREKSTLIVTHETIFDDIAEYQCFVMEGGICDGKKS